MMFGQQKNRGGILPMSTLPSLPGPMTGILGGGSLPGLPGQITDIPGGGSLPGMTPPLAQQYPAAPQNEPFIWSEGGTRLTPDQIELRQKAALAKTQMDFSPVQHWMQGVARVANAWVGASELRDLDRQAAAAEVDRRKSIAVLLAEGGSSSPSAGAPPADNSALIAGLLSNDPAVQKLAQARWERDNPKLAQPHYWESNNGSLFAVGPGGQPQEVYHDPSPKMNFIPDGMGGGQWVPLPTQVSGAPPASAPPMPAVGAVVADPRRSAGGGAGNGVGGFR